MGAKVGFAVVAMALILASVKNVASFDTFDLEVAEAEIEVESLDPALHELATSLESLETHLSTMDISMSDLILPESISVESINNDDDDFDDDFDDEIFMQGPEQVNRIGRARRRGLARISSLHGQERTLEEELYQVSLHFQQARDRSRRGGVVKIQWGVFRHISHAFHRAWHAVKRTASKIYHKVKKVGKVAFHKMKNFGKKAWHGIKKAGKTLAHGVKKGFHAAGKFGKHVFNKVKKLGKRALKKLKKAGKSAWHFIKTKGSKVMKGLKKFGKAALKGIKKIGKTMWKGLKTFGKYVWKFAKSPIGQMVIKGALEALDIPPMVSGPVLKLITTGNPASMLSGMIPGGAGKFLKGAGKLTSLIEKTGIMKNSPIFKKITGFVEGGGLKKIMSGLFSKNGVKKSMLKFVKGRLGKSANHGALKGAIKKFLGKEMKHVAGGSGGSGKKKKLLSSVIGKKIVGVVKKKVEEKKSSQPNKIRPILNRIGKNVKRRKKNRKERKQDGTLNFIDIDEVEN